MKYVYYFKFLAYTLLAFFVKNADIKMGCLILAALMLVFATQTAIEDYIDKKFAENKK